MQSSLPFSTILVPNRGEIAIRLLNAIHALNIQSATVYISSDATSPHVRLASRSFCLGSDISLYTDGEHLLSAAKTLGVDAVLPGYGFVSERPDVAAAFERNGITWIGPSSDVISLFGLKHTARDAAIRANVSIVPGSGLVHSEQHAIAEATSIGFPVLVKGSAGGGGMGQAIAHRQSQLSTAYRSVLKQCSTLYSSSEVYVEKFVSHARHIEVQVFGDGKGNVLVLGDRECSVQRRRQKVIEEGNAPNLSPLLRKQLREAAERLCAQNDYLSAGTVEFIVDSVTEDWYFLEVNTRLQVEHCVTELVTGIDIVKWMILQAANIDVLSDVAVIERGYAIEARVYAENPSKAYAPSSGTLSEMVWPKPSLCEQTGSRIRVDSWAERGSIVSPYYDPLLGKIISWGKTRALAIIALKKALEVTRVAGVASNVELLRQTIAHPQFLTARYTTDLLKTFSPKTMALEVVKPGLQSSLQDYPGRVGYWHIGVSPSGPMDAYAMCTANALVGNPISATALEITVTGPTLLFHCDAIVAVTGGSFVITTEDGAVLPSWTPVRVASGSTVQVAQAQHSENTASSSAAIGGKIGYVAIRGGFDVPKYLGSSSTFPTGKFGGLTGSFLVTGDFLPVGKDPNAEHEIGEQNGLKFRWPIGKQLPDHFIPEYSTTEWTVAALKGPHASLDFLQEETLAAIWTAPYTVHHATNRLGARLMGPVPKWTRLDGGSAGLHPSNLHDYAYAPGAVNFSGNTPIVLMLDGPSLGGFVCPITVATTEIWKMAQASPGEHVRFKQVDFDQARSAMSHMKSLWEAVRSYDMEGLERLASKWSPHWIMTSKPVDVPAVLASLDPAEGDEAEIKVEYRISGDEHVLVEYGDIELDLAYRFRVHMLMEELRVQSFISELCPGVRSVLIKYDPGKIHLNNLVKILTDMESGTLGSVENVVVPSRKLELPLAFEDKWTLEAQSRYLRSIRPDAPYMPSNVEFVRRINGLESIDQVKDTMNNAQYMVMGLGDVYLGAPCAVPVDPRHRMVTSKYNPARTFTPEGAVGIGGAYMCIYGMDSPGGYQLTGRTIPIWDSYGNIPEKRRGSPKDIPWLLRFFDRVTFFPVSDEELENIRSEYLKGNYQIKITEESFSYKYYRQFLEHSAKSIGEFETKRAIAYNEERSRWIEKGEGESTAAAQHAKGNGDDNGPGSKSLSGDLPIGTGSLPPGHVYIRAGMSANVWSVDAGESQSVSKGQPLFTLESMKVEITIEAPTSGFVERISVKKGDVVSPDTALCVLISSTENVISQCDVSYLRSLYHSRIFSAKQVIENVMRKVANLENVFTSLATEAQISSQLQALEVGLRNHRPMPLFGVPFVVGANIDALGFETHPDRPGRPYTSKETSPLVHCVQEAGAVLVGKTTEEQFNLGYSHCETGGEQLQNPKYPGSICGGHGSAAVAVSEQAASFAIVVDRNGNSTNAPAFTSIVGMKVTEGLLPVSNNSTDCASIFANNAMDIKQILTVCLEARTKTSPMLRPLPNWNKAAGMYDRVTIGTLSTQGEELATDATFNAVPAYQKGINILGNHQNVIREVDISPFEVAASLCQEYPVLLLKLEELHDAFRSQPKDLLPSVLQRIRPLENMSSLSTGTALSKLEHCVRDAERRVWSEVDILCLPVITIPNDASEVSRNLRRATSSLKHYAQLVTCMDLCALTLPLSSEEENAAPGGIMLVAPMMREEMLLRVGSQWP
ncbi:unnamed protein product [Agarophyton chilense]|eukprot:gb/GEZJ01002931.1/.p1 GENE.gb/GEZJ01002931.1/~~gb/GEZJ01002931.1/.p1  ORF type:complete len:1719 (-),score=239.71 gb/GEZJ01002931.1/:2267-7423(-)